MTANGHVSKSLSVFWWRLIEWLIDSNKLHSSNILYLFPSFIYYYLSTQLWLWNSIVGSNILLYTAVYFNVNVAQSYWNLHPYVTWHLQQWNLWVQYIAGYLKIDYTTNVYSFILYFEKYAPWIALFHKPIKMIYSVKFKFHTLQMWPDYP